jgi:hypothetical protein
MVKITPRRMTGVFDWRKKGARETRMPTMTCTNFLESSGESFSTVLAISAMPIKKMMIEKNTRNAIHSLGRSKKMGTSKSFRSGRNLCHFNTPFRLHEAKELVKMKGRN